MGAYYQRHASFATDDSAGAALTASARPASAASCHRPRYAEQVAIFSLEARKGPAAFAAAIAVLAATGLTLALAYLVYQYLRLGESYTRLISG